MQPFNLLIILNIYLGNSSNPLFIKMQVSSKGFVFLSYMSLDYINKKLLFKNLLFTVIQVQFLPFTHI